MNISPHTQIPVAELLPHQGKMLLIDEIIASGDNWLHARTRIKADNIFMQDNKVSSVIGIELMAQTVAAFAGKLERAKNGKPKIGFLLGTRHYQSNVSHFELGEELVIAIELDYLDLDGLGIFNCSVTGKNAKISAKINVFYPEKTDALTTILNNKDA